MDVPPAFIVILSYYGGVIYLLCTLQESGSLKSDFELTTQRDSSLTKETNWLGIFSRHESFNAREAEDREALGIRLRLLMGDGDYPLEKCIYTVTGLLLPRK